jgi:hypothetical protein
VPRGAAHAWAAHGHLLEASYVGYQARADDGSTFITTALDVAAAGDTPEHYVLDVGQACASVINAKLKLHGLKLVRPQATHR